jgi:hypothetical protein
MAAQAAWGEKKYSLISAALCIMPKRLYRDLGSYASHRVRQGRTEFGLPTNEKFRPVKVSFFGREAIVQVAGALAHLIEQPSSAKCGHAGFHDIFYNCKNILRGGSKAIFQAVLRRKVCPDYPAAPRSSRRFCGVNYVGRIDYFFQSEIEEYFMAKNFRIFTSFAIEDANLRNLLVGQGRNKKTPFEFVDMSVKEPWDSAWKTNCRTKIKGSDGVIGIITNNTVKATGQLWELQCAYDESIPVLLIYGNDDRPANLPAPIKGRLINLWTWDNVSAFLDKL